MLASLIGVITLWKTIGQWVSKHITLLVSLSAGVLAVVSYGLLTESFELLPAPEAIIWIAVGATVILLISRISPEYHHHHHHDDCQDDCDQQENRPHAFRILVADAVHNISDGIILVPAYLASFELGIAVTIGVLIHEMMQEISEFFILKQAGLSTQQALARNFLASSTILVGVAISIVLTQVAGLEGVLIALSAGAFIAVLFADIIPHSLGTVRGMHLLKHLAFAVVGMVAMFGVNSVTADTHVHSGGHAHGDEHGHHEEHEDEHDHIEEDHDEEGHDEHEDEHHDH